MNTTQHDLILDMCNVLAEETHVVASRILDRFQALCEHFPNPGTQPVEPGDPPSTPGNTPAH
jgi:hypothetical protein